MSIEKILFPTKFRELAFDALDSLLVLKEAGLKEIIFLHVILREDVGFVPFGGYLKKEEEKMRAEARIRLEDWQKTLDEKGIKSSIHIEVGEPVHEILALAEKERVDLVVVGRKKRIDIEHTFIGSYTHKFITRAKFMTFVSKYRVEYKFDNAELTKVNDRPFENPLVTVGGAEELAQRVIDSLKKFKGAVKKAIVFFNIDEKMIDEKDEAEMAQLKEECKQTCRKYCEQLEAEGIEAEMHLGAGGILDEILRVSRERKASMIVAGNTSEHRFLENLLHRSLSYQVAKVSELPVLLVP
jgi:nucleotide-binding universal stress UspA family protein